MPGLQADQAEADTRVARARAEERRSFAIAREQEMKAKVAESRAHVVEAEVAGADGHGRGLSGRPVPHQRRRRVSPAR